LRQLRVGDIDDRISLLMEEIAQGMRDPNIRRIAGRELRKAGVESQDWEGEADAMFEYTRKAVRYTRDPRGVELFQSPPRSLDHGIGDCDDQVIFLGSLLLSIGYPIILRVIGLKGSNQFQHIYILAGLPPDNPTQFKPYDPSQPHPAGWELPEHLRGQLRDYEFDDQ
jgi:hypothetical protein